MKTHPGRTFGQRAPQPIFTDSQHFGVSVQSDEAAARSDNARNFKRMTGRSQCAIHYSRSGAEMKNFQNFSNHHRLVVSHRLGSLPGVARLVGTLSVPWLSPWQTFQNFRQVQRLRFRAASLRGAVRQNIPGRNHYCGLIAAILNFRNCSFISPMRFGNCSFQASPAHHLQIITTSHHNNLARPDRTPHRRSSLAHEFGLCFDRQRSARPYSLALFLLGRLCINICPAYAASSESRMILRNDFSG